LALLNRITRINHPLVKHLIKLRKNRGYRYRHRSVLIEGKKLVNEFLEAWDAKHILTTDPEQLKKTTKTKGMYEVTDVIIDKISGLKTPEGVLAEVPMPEESSLLNMRYLIAFDGVSDPGNLGTLFRTALAFGWQGAFLLGNCCDPFNDKALRAAKGATFRLPLRRGTWKQLDEIIKANQMQSVAADLEGTPLPQFSSQSPLLLILGSEAGGISAQTRKRSLQVTIPIAEVMESLNVSVAGGVLMYALKNKFKLE